MTYSRLLRAAIAATALTFTSVTGVVAQTITEFPVPMPNPSVPSLPTGITAGPDGNVWFTDQGNLNLQTSPPTVLSIGLITPTGAISQFSLSARPFQGPSGIVTGPDGALWFTVGLTNNVIGRITTGGNATSSPIPTPNSNLSDIAENITVGSDGALWFTSCWEDRPNHDSWRDY